MMNMMMNKKMEEDTMNESHKQDTPVVPRIKFDEMVVSEDGDDERGREPLDYLLGEILEEVRDLEEGGGQRSSKKIEKFPKFLKNIGTNSKRINGVYIAFFKLSTFIQGFSFIE